MLLFYAILAHLYRIEAHQLSIEVLLGLGTPIAITAIIHFVWLHRHQIL